MRNYSNESKKYKSSKIKSIFILNKAGFKKLLKKTYATKEKIISGIISSI